jgi:hypothetical protein
MRYKYCGALHLAFAHQFLLSYKYPGALHFTLPHNIGAVPAHDVGPAHRDICRKVHLKPMTKVQRTVIL